MRKWGWIVAVAAVPSVTAAQPSSQEAQLRVERLELAPNALGAVRWSVAGQLAGGAERRDDADVPVLDTAVAAEFAVDGDACRVLYLGGQARLRREDADRALAAEQQLSVCLMGGGMLPTVQLDQAYELDLRPAFSAPRTLRRRRYRRLTIGMDIVEFRIPVPEYGATLEFAHLDFGVSAAFQQEADENVEALEMSVDSTMLAWVKPRDDGALRVDLFAFRLRQSGDDEYAIAVDFAPVRLRGVRLGGGVVLDAEAAWAHASLGRHQITGPPDHRTYDTLSTDVSVERRGRAVNFGAGYARGFRTTIDTDVILEDRLHGWATLHRGRTRYTLRAFCAHTALFTYDDGASDAAFTGGAELAVAYDLGEHVQLGLHAEVARTYFADIHSDSAPSPEVGARFVGVLATHFGSD